MSKVDQLRAMREARAASRAPFTASALTPVRPPVRHPKPPASPVASPFVAPATETPTSPPLTRSPEPAEPVLETPPVETISGPVPSSEPTIEAPANPSYVQPASGPVPAADGQLGRPDVAPGKLIGAYKAHELEALVAWIQATGQASTLEDTTTLVMAELGFVRRGKVIRARVAEALAATQPPAAEAG